MSTHVCSHCPKGVPPKPHDLRYFNRYRKAPSGLDGVCRECRRRVQQASLDATRGRGEGAVAFPELVRGSRWRLVLSGAECVIKVSAVVSDANGNHRVMGTVDGKRRMLLATAVRETGVRIDVAA